MSPSTPPFLTSYQKSRTSNASLNYSNAASLATVDLNFNPSVRMVNICDVDVKQYNCVYFTTNAHAGKIPELKLCLVDDEQSEAPQQMQIFSCELCHYFPLSREQFRMRCSVRILDENTSNNDFKLVRKRIWDASPGWLAINGKSTTSETPSSNTPHPDFVVIQLIPSRCDYVRLPPPTEVDRSKPLHKESQLKPARHIVRWLHRKDAAGQWILTELNP
jgi:hypothetical protein